jgi:quinol monooxygenase YgiN
MYGTCAKMRVKAENVEALQKTMADQMSGDPVPGYIRSYVLNENDSDAFWLFVMFEDRASYDKNADDPAQHERYTAMRALLEADPEWHDGMVMEG